MALDPEVDNLMENGNMEQLAGLVLNGEGRRLVGRQSGNPELQAFIDNVPAYMVRHYRVIIDSEPIYNLSICHIRERFMPYTWLREKGIFAIYKVLWIDANLQ